MALRRRHSSSDSDNSARGYIVLNRRRRIYRPRINFNISECFYFNERFRVSVCKVEEIILLIGGQISHRTDKNCALSPRQQLLTALHWIGNGGQYHGISDMHGISKATVCRCVNRVCSAIVDILFEDVVRWPNEMDEIPENFHDIAGMPCVCGCIDGTLINIDDFEPAYVDRHGNHSINCMLVCGPDLTFYNAYVNWPGSVHDSRVLRRSPLYTLFESGFRPFPHAMLLGDTGYPSLDWLGTPILRTTSVAMDRYSRAHKSTRRLIENAIGILKEKFPCLKHLRLQSRKAIKIIKCCIILYNISRQPEDNEIEIPANLEEEPNIEYQQDEALIEFHGTPSQEHISSNFS